MAHRGDHFGHPLPLSQGFVQIESGGENNGDKQYWPLDQMMTGGVNGAPTIDSKITQHCNTRATKSPELRGEF